MTFIACTSFTLIGATRANCATPATQQYRHAHIEQQLATQKLLSLLHNHPQAMLFTGSYELLSSPNGSSHMLSNFTTFEHTIQTAYSSLLGCDVHRTAVALASAGTASLWRSLACRGLTSARWTLAVFLLQIATQKHEINTTIAATGTRHRTAAKRTVLSVPIHNSSV